MQLEDETVWLTQERMAILFGKGRSTVTEHIIKIYDEGELEQNQTCRKFRRVWQEGARQVEREHYNLDVIIYVGYRVKSKQDTKFRQWATKRIHEYLVKGFTMDNELTKEFFATVQNKYNFMILSYPKLIKP